jgi:hypothetical protein
MKRDSQRSKLYTAEEVLRGAPEDRAALDAFIGKVMRSAKVKGLVGPRRYRLVGPSAWCTPSWDGDKIVFSAGQRFEVLHGLAHLVVPGSNEVAFHGPEFCRCYLDLVRRFLGPEQAAVLREAFKVHRVKHRVVSSESRQAARDRFMARKEADLEADLRRLQARFGAGGG